MENKDCARGVATPPCVNCCLIYVNFNLRTERLGEGMMLKDKLVLGCTVRTIAMSRASIGWLTGVKTDFGTRIPKSVNFAVQTQGKCIPSKSNSKQANMDWIFWSSSRIKI